MSISQRAFTAVVLAVVGFVGFDAVHDKYEDGQAQISRSIEAIGADTNHGWGPGVQTG